MKDKNISNVGASYWQLENNVSDSFNRLKGYIFNLIEFSSLTNPQQEAMKGLVRGFANEEYRKCVEEMRWTAKRAKILDSGSDQSIPPLTASPLESRKIGE